MTIILYHPHFEQFTLVEFEDWFGELVTDNLKCGGGWHYIGEL